MYWLDGVTGMLSPPHCDPILNSFDHNGGARDKTPERPAGKAVLAEAPTTPPRREQRLVYGKRSWIGESSGSALRPQPAGADVDAWAAISPQVRASIGTTHASADHLREHLCQPGQPLHGCLTALYGSVEMAEHEIARSLTALRRLGDAGSLPLERRGKVAVLLPRQQPFYALVTEVVLAATLSEQVRATTSFGPMQQASRQIFDWLAQSMRAEVSHAADGSIQQWRAATLGSMMLVHPGTPDSAMRLSLALPAHPDAILWTSSVDDACAMSLQARGCSIIMPRLPCACIVVAEQPPASLVAAAAAVAVDLTRHRHRPGGVPEVILLHAHVATDFFAELMGQLALAQRPAPLAERNAQRATVYPEPALMLRSLSSADSAARLAPPAGVDIRSQPPTLTILSYQRDEELTDYFDDLTTLPLQVSLFGRSPAVSYVVPADRLRRGKTAIQAEDELAAYGGGGQPSLCLVSGNEVSFVSTPLMAQLRRALGSPEASCGGTPTCLFARD